MSDVYSCRPCGRCPDCHRLIARHFRKVARAMWDEAEIGMSHAKTDLTHGYKGSKLAGFLTGSSRALVAKGLRMAVERLEKQAKIYEGPTA